MGVTVKIKYLWSVALVALMFGSSSVIADNHKGKTLEDVIKILEEQQAEIAELKAQLGEGGAETINTPQSPDAVGAQRSRWAPTGGKKKIAAGSWAAKTSVGGYGELHSEILTGQDGANDINRNDIHRFILFVGHEFSDSIRLATELEIEHSFIGDGNPGDVVLELMWLEMDINSNHHFRAGADILPIGLLNLTHEPTTFYGVDRNSVEAEVIPTTWTEATAGLWGSIAPGWNYNLNVHSGLVIPTTGSSAMRPRSGRQKVGNATDQDIAIMGRILYNGMPGLEVAYTFDYHSDYTGTADAIEADSWLNEFHVHYEHRSGFGMRALYARWDFSEDNGFDPEAFDADDIMGWYVEPSYKTDIMMGQLGVFYRYSVWNERDGTAGNPFVQMHSHNMGVNWWPMDNQSVVFKFEYQNEDGDGASSGSHDGIKFGLGFQF